MTDQTDRNNSIIEWRRRAEDASPKSSASFSDDREPQSLEEARIMLKELRARRIELERLNEESLRESYAKLFESNQLLSGVLEHTHMMAVFLDRQFNFIWVNRAYADTCKQDPSFFPGKNHFELYPNAENQTIFQRVVDTGQPFFVAAKLFEFPDQPERGMTWWDWSLIPLKDDSGFVTGLVFTLAEVTDRIKALEALWESESRFRSVIDSAPDAIFIQTGGNFVFVNPASLALFGAAGPSDLLGKPVVEFMHPDFRSIVAERIHSLNLGRTAVSCLEQKYLRCDGTVVDVEAEGVPFTFLGEQGALVFARDITKRKQAEENLKNQEEKYRTVADFTYDWKYWLSPEGRFHYVSPSCERITGYRPEEFQEDPKLWIRLVHPEDRSGIVTHFKEEHIFLQADKPFIEFRIITRSGEEKWIGHVCQAVFNKSGQYIGRRGSNRDISIRKQSEEKMALLEAQNRLLQKSESLGRMAGAIAHHFNNQLHAVTGNLEMAMEEPAGPDLSAFLANALTATKNAANVSSLMLAYLGQTIAKKEPLDICKVCDQSLSLLYSHLPESVRLETDFVSPGLSIKGDINQIQQVLINLVINAGEACEGSGSIQLRIWKVSAKEIPTASRRPVQWEPKDDTYACLEVSDTGCGIPEKDIDKLFDPFFTTKFTGRGMGLSVVFGIVNGHGGAITVDSRVGEGSLFRVYLPILAEAVTQPIKHRPVVPKDGAATTVLVVEDEELIRIMLDSMLKRLGFKVKEAKDGKEAVEIFTKHKDEIGLVLSDIIMPEMNGWEMLAALRKISRDIRVIFASGHDEEQVMAGDHPEQPNAFLHKPFYVNDLSTAIQRMLGNGSSPGPKGFQGL